MTTVNGTMYMPILYMEHVGCGWTHIWQWGLDLAYQPFLYESSHNSGCTLPVPLKLNSWSHLQFTLSLTGTVNWWLNGHQFPTPCSMSYFDDEGFPTARVGRGADPGFGTYLAPNRFWGEIAEFTLWNRTLPSEQLLMQHVFHEPRSIATMRHKLNFFGLPTYKNFTPVIIGREVIQTINWTLPFAANPYDYDAAQLYNVTTLINGTWVNVTHEYPRDTNFTQFERELVLGVNCTIDGIITTELFLQSCICRSV